MLPHTCFEYKFDGWPILTYRTFKIDLVIVPLCYLLKTTLLTKET